jgi:hypothetical protein
MPCSYYCCFINLSLKKAWLCGRFAGIAGSNPSAGVNFSADGFVLSGRGLYLELITRPKESYLVRCARV